MTVAQGCKCKNFLKLVRPLSAVIALIFASFSQQVSSQMTDKLLPENQLEETLIGTTWTGTVFGEKFDYYFLDERVLVYRTRKGVFAKSHWHVSQGKLSIDILNNPDYPLQLSLSGRLDDGKIVGTAENYLRVASERKIEKAPWILEQLPMPISELLAAVPQHRSTALPLPSLNLLDFVGTYVSATPTVDRQNGPPVRYELRCELATGCNMKIAKQSHDEFDSVGPLHRYGYQDVNRSLDAARRHKFEALQLEPWLSKLLESDSKILNCLDLRRTKRTGGVSQFNILCRLDKNPWNEPVLLYKAAFLDHCVTAGCRYGFVPLFRNQ